MKPPIQSATLPPGTSDAVRDSRPARDGLRVSDGRFVIEPNSQSPAAHHRHRCRNVGSLALCRRGGQASRPRHQSHRSRGRRASGRPVEQGAQREAHGNLRPRARISRHRRGRRKSRRWRRCQDWRCRFQPLWRLEEADRRGCCATWMSWFSIFRISALASTPTSRPWGSPCRRRPRRVSPSSFSIGPIRSAATTSPDSSWSRRCAPSSANTPSPSCTA